MASTAAPPTPSSGPVGGSSPRRPRRPRHRNPRRSRTARRRGARRQPVPGPVRDTSHDRRGAGRTVKGIGARPGRWTAGIVDQWWCLGFRVSATLMDQDWAVVVLPGPAPSSSPAGPRSSTGVGQSSRSTGAPTTPTTNGGTWRSVAATSYATVSKEPLLRRRRRPRDPGGRGSVVRTRAHRLQQATLTPGGRSVLSFRLSPSCWPDPDDARRSVATPFDGVPDCGAWDGLRTGTARSRSVVPDEHRVGNPFHAKPPAGRAASDLGPQDRRDVDVVAGPRSSVPGPAA